MKSRSSITIYALVIFIAVLSTWIAHEGAHWLTSEMLGYKTLMTLNSTRLAKGHYAESWQPILVSIAGPLFTVLQAFIAFLWLKRKGWSEYIYPFLFTAFYMRALAGFMNFINLNDEGRVSHFLGYGTFLLPLIFSGVLFYLVYSVSSTYHLSRKYQISTLLLVMLFSSVLILSDQWLHIQLL